MHASYDHGLFILKAIVYAIAHQHVFLAENDLIHSNITGGDAQHAHII